MPSIGSFGAAVREIDPDAEPVTFTFFDTEFTVLDAIPPWLTIQLGAVAAGKLPMVDGNAAIYEVFRCSLTKPAPDGEDADESQFERFRGLAVSRRCDDDELFKLVWALVGAQADLPTERQPTSPGGQPPTSESSSSSASDTPDSSRLASVEDRLAGLA